MLASEYLFPKSSSDDTERLKSKQVSDDLMISAAQEVSVMAGDAEHPSSITTITRTNSATTTLVTTVHWTLDRVRLLSVPPSVLKWAANFKFGNTSVTALRLV